MKLNSPNFRDNEVIPAKYTCDGDNINPALNFVDIPANTKSLVLIMDDPDAIKPAGKVWDHWICFNIPPNTATILESEEPQCIHGQGTSGNLKYTGPCPPDGEHHYVFKLYALDSKLNLPEKTTKTEIEKAMQNHIIEQVKLIGKYKKQ